LYWTAGNLYDPLFSLYDATIADGLSQNRHINLRNLRRNLRDNLQGFAGFIYGLIRGGICALIAAGFAMFASLRGI
jgi:hypothetical protein